MDWGKGKTEEGQGGKLGHSNRDGLGYHDEEKAISRKQRRLGQKRLILDESSKVDLELKAYANELLNTLYRLGLEFELHEFDSGAAMIDFWIKDQFYCIQMTDNLFGWTKVDAETGLSTIPDSGYLNWEDFKQQFNDILYPA